MKNFDRECMNIPIFKY